MPTSEEIQKDLQFRNLVGSLEQVNEMLVNSSNQLSAIASSLLNLRQHLAQIKALMPPPVAPAFPAKPGPETVDNLAAQEALPAVKKGKNV
jgi:hypothetical protein